MYLSMLSIGGELDLEGEFRIRSVATMGRCSSKLDTGHHGGLRQEELVPYLNANSSEEAIRYYFN